MVRASPNLNSFDGGEFAPSAEGRTDLSRYNSACRILENFLPLTIGPASRRPGAKFVASTRFPDKLAVLLPFLYSTEQAYTLEIGDAYTRFYRNDGPLLEAAKAITGVTAANPVELTVVAHGWATDQDIEVSGILGMTQLNGRRFRITKTGANTVTLKDQHGTAIDGTAYSAYVSGGSGFRVYTLTTPWLEQDLTGLKIAQSVDTLYVTHQEYVPRKLQRYGATNWVLSKLDFIDGPYLPVNTSQATLTLGATSGASVTLQSTTTMVATGMADNGAGSIRVTKATHGWKTGDIVDIATTVGTVEANGTWTVIRINASTFDLAGSAFANAWVSGGTITPHIFVSTDVGRLVRLQHTTTWGWGKIVSYVSAVSVTIDIIGTFSAATATATWRLGLYSEGGGYPTCVTIYEGRLWLGGCPLLPTRIDASVSPDVGGINYETFSPSSSASVVSDSDALQYPLDSGDVNNVLWMKDDERGLLVGTKGGEWLVRSNALGDALTPTNVQAKRGSTYGSYENSQPVRTGKEVAFVEEKRQKVRNLSYTYTIDGFDAGDLTLLATHIAGRDGFGQMAYQSKPKGWIWIVRGDGQIALLGYDRGEEKIGWSRQILGGFQDVARLRPAAVESLASIPAPMDPSYEVWTLTRRTINGKTERYVEVIQPGWEEGDDQEQAFYLDSALTFDGAIAQTLQPGAGATVKGTTGVTFTAGGSVFIVSDVGREITLRYFDYSDLDPENPAQMGAWKTARAKVTGYTSATVVTATILGAFQDLGLIASGGWRLSAESLSNLWHLEGETISILGEGATHPDVVVVNGTAALDRSMGYAVAGLACPARLQTMRIEAGSQDGTSQGKTKRINEVTVRTVQSLGVEVGPDFSTMTPLSYRDTTVPLGTPPQIFDGDGRVLWEKGYDTKGRLAVRQASPFPCTIIAILPQVTTYDRG